MSKYTPSKNPVQEKIKKAVLREDLVALVKDPIEALILNQCLYWTENKYFSDLNLAKQVETLLKHGNAEAAALVEQQMSHGWFYKSAQEMTEEVMNICSRATVDRKFRSLVERGYLSTKENPEKREGKHTKFYRANIMYIREELEKIGYVLADYSISQKSAETDGAANPNDTDSNEQSENTAQPRFAQNEQSKSPIAHHDQSITHGEQSLHKLLYRDYKILNTEEEEDNITREEVAKYEMYALTYRSMSIKAAAISFSKTKNFLIYACNTSSLLRW